MGQFISLKLGESLLTQSLFKFSLNGWEVEILFLDAEKFNFAKRLKMLQALTKLPSISTVVPVTFYLTFEQKLNNRTIING